MTSPSIPLPDTLPLAYPDQERVLVELLEHFWPDKVVAWLPSNPPEGTIWVQRIGGGPDTSDITDYAQMRVSNYADTRHEAWNQAADIERVLLGHRGRMTPTGWFIDTVDIEVGGSIDPDLDPDDRRVTKNYVIGMRRQGNPEV